MPFTDHSVAKALEIFISRNEKLQKELANLSRQPGGLYVEELRARHAQAAYLNAVEEQGPILTTSRCASWPEPRLNSKRCESHAARSFVRTFSAGTYPTLKSCRVMPTTASSPPHLRELWVPVDLNGL